MGFTILEPGEFLSGFVGELAGSGQTEGFDAFCKSLERKHDEDMKGTRERHASALSMSEQDKSHISTAATEKEHAFKRCKEGLEAIFKRDKARLGEIYAKMANAKLSGDPSGVGNFRAELFANTEKVRQEREEVWKEYQTRCAQIALSFVSKQNEKNKKLSDRRAAQSKEFKEYETEKLNEKETQIKGKIDEFNSKFDPVTAERQYVDIFAAEPLVENYECKRENPASVRLGALSYDLSPLTLGKHAVSMLEEHYPTLYKQGTLNIPYGTVFDENFNYRFAVGPGDAKGRETLIDRACSLAMRLFMMIPPNKVNFTFIDPIDLGHNFALFTRLVDVDDRTNKVINGKIWTAAEDIGERLRVLTDHIANVTQRCLQGKYKSIQEYNKDAEQNAEPYQILMIMDFPGGFNETSLGMLEKIISTGPKCGVYTVILKSGEQLAKADERLKLLINNIESRTKCFFVQNEEIKLRMDVLNEKMAVPFKIAPLLSKEHLDIVIPKLKDGIKNVERVVINFDKRKELLPAKGDWFKGNSSPELVIPIGISGANKVQNLVFGASAYHALLIGQTGSGKSSLLHTIIMSALVRYPADELSIFLVDFKRGVEFKIYANHTLKAFRAVAIESEREFGGSVLAFLDKEQSRRAELFRRENVDNIQAYRDKKDKNGKNFLLPRILLIIDEFHVLFSKDNDNMGKNAASHLEQIIKQGRAFGVHVVLASQTMANVGGIHQSLWGQVGIRIALKCPPSDAKLILAEDNDGVDLLAANEPGLAVYNSDCGNKVANTVFRVAYMEQDIQNELLKEISNKAPEPQTAFSETRVMVSNIEDNLYHPYQKFIDGGKPGEFDERAVLIGEPLQLSGKLRSGFKPKESSNMLIIGSDARKARAMLAFSALSLSIHAIAKNGWKKPRGQSVYIMDFAPPEEEDEKEHDVLVMLKRQIRDHVKYEEFNDSIDLLKALHENLSNKENAAEGRYLLLFGLQRARGLRQGGDPNSVKKNAASAMGDGLGLDIAPKSSVTPYQMLLSVLKDGPENNTHAIVWADNFKTFQAHYPGLLQLFDLRVGFTMANEDSVLFMEEPEGSQIGENNAVLSYNGNQKFRTYQTPDAGWLAEICERINSF